MRKFGVLLRDTVMMSPDLDSTSPVSLLLSSEMGAIPYTDSMTIVISSYGV